MNEAEADPTTAGLPPEDLFTLESVRALLLEHVFRDKGPTASLRMPSREALGKLAETLRVITRKSQLGPQERFSVTMAKELGKAIERIDTLLPPVAADTSKQQGEAARLLSILESDGYQDSFGEVVTEDQRQSVLASMRKAPATLEAEARSMEALRLAIAGMMRHPRFFGPIDPYFFEKDSWRCLAEDIADALRLSFASTNPTTTLGASNDGPVPRFIAAVVPLITGESPNVGNVAQCLKTATRDKPKS